MRRKLYLYDRDKKEKYRYDSIGELFFDLKIFYGKNKEIKVEVGNETEKEHIKESKE